MFEKTVSEKQLAANRENAKKSTGPTSTEGKAQSRRNACRHYLTSQVIMMADEDHDAYVAYEKSFMLDLKPEGTLETNLVHNIAHGFWRLQRAEAMEENYLTLQSGRGEDDNDAANGQVRNAALQCLNFFNDPDKFVRLSLYEQRIHRRTEQDLRTFHALQAKRAAKQTDPCQPEKVMSASVSATEPQAPKTSPAGSMTYPENGFDFSNGPHLTAESPTQPELMRDTPHEEAEIPNAA